MTRFDLDMDGSMEPSEHGRWVRYEDAQRKPLTSEEVSDLRIKHGITSNGRGIKEFTQIVDFVRDIEAAHNIKENT